MRHLSDAAGSSGLWTCFNQVVAVYRLSRFGAERPRISERECGAMHAGTMQQAAHPLFIRADFWRRQCEDNVMQDNVAQKCCRVLELLPDAARIFVCSLSFLQCFSTERSVRPLHHMIERRFCTLHPASFSFLQAMQSLITTTMHTSAAPQIPPTRDCLTSAGVCENRAFVEDHFSWK